MNVVVGDFVIALIITIGVYTLVKYLLNKRGDSNE